MIHISKTKAGFVVANVSRSNGKLAHISEVLKTKDSVKKNIAALIRATQYGNGTNPWVFVQDNTSEKFGPRIMRYCLKGTPTIAGDGPDTPKLVTPYVPGKSVRNHKK